MALLFPEPTDRIPYPLLAPDEQRALHDWLTAHRVDYDRVPLYARFDLDEATGEWRIPVYWVDADGRMRVDERNEVRQHVLRRRELRPLPWPVYGPPTIEFNGVDISEYVTGIEVGPC